MYIVFLVQTWEPLRPLRHETWVSETQCGGRGWGPIQDVVQSHSCVRLLATLWTAARQRGAC